MFWTKGLHLHLSSISAALAIRFMSNCPQFPGNYEEGPGHGHEGKREVVGRL